MKVLIISRYFPPTNNASVYRIVSFANEFCNKGHEVVVLTSHVNWEPYDENLCNLVCGQLSVIRTKGWRLGRSKWGRIESNNSWLDKIIKKLLNVVEKSLPIDPNILWVIPGICCALKLYRSWHYDVVLVTSPPHSVQLIGLLLKILLPIKYVADFRDGWYHNYWKMVHGKRNGRIEKKIESIILNRADLILANTNMGKNLLMRDFCLSGDCVRVVTNGYLQTESASKSSSVDNYNDSDCNIGGTNTAKIELCYTGELYPGYVDYLFELLVHIKNKHMKIYSKLIIRFVGIYGDEDVTKAKEQGIDEIICFEGMQPYSVASSYMERAHCGLVLQNMTNDMSHIVPSKLYSCMGMLKPVIAVVPEGEVSEIIQKTRCGIALTGRNVETDCEKLVCFISNINNIRINPQRIKKYDRTVIASSLVNDIEALRA